MGKYTVRGTISIPKLLDTIAMIIEKRENVKVTVKILTLEKEDKEMSHEEVK
ncbi:hypothetical protein GKZ28_14660 [Clostridium chromiireducens]|uniref:Uncharacterized protein n=1 Tax=Clostridium chromiireducens TaxID=225345 RepID=A0A964RN23_9CLOT|nr:hypothetical protein [Clostridium chromiireducens]MVX64934.1 hypothetical protein [Clostridium chromiireducens]